MVHEAKKESYRGVLCRWCRQPIPVPSIVAVLDRAESKESCQPDGLNARVFHLRCRACEYEYLYKSSDVVDFEGRPRPRSSQVYSAHALSSQSQARAKAANG
jgi:hypothetical protein